VGYLIRTRSGDKGPFVVDKLRELVDRGKVPGSLKVVHEDTGERVVLSTLLEEPPAARRPGRATPGSRVRAGKGRRGADRPGQAERRPARGARRTAKRDDGPRPEKRASKKPRSGRGASRSSGKRRDADADGRDRPRKPRRSSRRDAGASEPLPAIRNQVLGVICVPLITFGMFMETRRYEQTGTVQHYRGRRSGQKELAATTGRALGSGGVLALGGLITLVAVALLVLRIRKRAAFRARR